MSEHTRLGYSKLCLCCLQLLDKLKETVAVPDFVQETITRCAESRDAACLHELKTTVLVHGKKILHEVLFGGSIPQAFHQNAFMQFRAI